MPIDVVIHLESTLGQSLAAICQRCPRTEDRFSQVDRCVDALVVAAHHAARAVAEPTIAAVYETAPGKHSDRNRNMEMRGLRLPVPLDLKKYAAERYRVLLAARLPEADLLLLLADGANGAPMRFSEGAREVTLLEGRRPSFVDGRLADQDSHVMSLLALDADETITAGMLRAAFLAGADGDVRLSLKPTTYVQDRVMRQLWNSQSFVDIACDSVLLAMHRHDVTSDVRLTFFVVHDSDAERDARAGRMRCDVQLRRDVPDERATALSDIDSSIELMMTTIAEGVDDNEAAVANTTFSKVMLGIRFAIWVGAPCTPADYLSKVTEHLCA